MYKVLYHVKGSLTRDKPLHIRRVIVCWLNAAIYTFDSRSKSPESFVLEDFTRDYEKGRLKGQCHEIF